MTHVCSFIHNQFHISMEKNNFRFPIIICVLWTSFWISYEICNVRLVRYRFAVNLYIYIKIYNIDLSLRTTVIIIPWYDVWNSVRPTPLRCKYIYIYIYKFTAKQCRAYRMPLLVAAVYIYMTCIQSGKLPGAETTIVFCIWCDRMYMYL